jgi:hypothetical protein
MGTKDVVKQSGDALMAAFDKGVEVQWQRARSTVSSLRRRMPGADADELVAKITRDFCRDLAAVGGTAGAVSALPGAGTAVRVTVGLTGEAFVLLERSIHMVLAVAHVHDHDLEELEVRRFAILRVLAVWAGVAEGMAPFTTMVASGLGKRATKAIPMSAVDALNKAVGKRVLVKWSTKSGALRLGSVLPFGIGAGLGAGGNYLMAKGLARAAVVEFK